jgi:hypothetical protein
MFADEDAGCSVAAPSAVAGMVVGAAIDNSVAVGLVLPDGAVAVAAVWSVFDGWAVRAGCPEAGDTTRRREMGSGTRMFSVTKPRPNSENAAIRTANAMRENLDMASLLETCVAGWHLQCQAVTGALLKPGYDIHTTLT